MVKVYQFFVSQSDGDDDWLDPGYKSSREHLEKVQGVRIKIIESSEEEIDPAKLDPDGRYFSPN
jgi:hypothetical protein